MQVKFTDKASTLTSHTQLEHYAPIGVRTVDAYAAHGWTGVMLRPDNDAPGNTADDYRRYGHRGRRINAVNWEAHAEFLQALFEDHPDAVVRTSSPQGKFTIVADDALITMRGSSRTKRLADWLKYSSRFAT